jgi:hypothetical protein
MIGLTSSSGTRHGRRRRAEREGAARSRNMHQHVNHHPFNAMRKMACNFGWQGTVEVHVDVGRAGEAAPLTVTATIETYRLPDASKPGRPQRWSGSSWQGSTGGGLAGSIPMRW